MKTIPFDESARDVWHDASVEVPDTDRNVYAIDCTGNAGIRFVFINSAWSTSKTITHWRELPAPPKPTPKIVPHSLEHWHYPKVERPEGGKRFVIMYHSGMMSGSTLIGVLDWDIVFRWTYAPETSR